MRFEGRIQPRTESEVGVLTPWNVGLGGSPSEKGTEAGEVADNG